MKRPWLLPLVPVYWVGLTVKEWMRGEPKRLARPVISVGSLSAGGAGKTPVVMGLCELLGGRGVGVDVLSRGYGRGSGVVERVVGEDAGRYGDEPVVMARAGLEVWVGAERVAAGRAAEREGSAAVHVLDDGFQHRRLGRELDVVLLTAEDARDCLLPAGNLRESASALGRADVVVLRAEEAEALRGYVRQRTEAEVWVIERTLRVEAGGRSLVFCGIARAVGFFGMVRAAGCELVGTHTFPDHHAYTEEDVERLCVAASHAGADRFVTTAKDVVKLTPPMRAKLEEIGPVVVAELRVTFLEEERVLGRIRGLHPLPG